MSYKCSDHHYWNTDDVLGHGATCVVFKGISEVTSPNYVCSSLDPLKVTAVQLMTE